MAPGEADPLIREEMASVHGLTAVTAVRDGAEGYALSEPTIDRRNGPNQILSKDANRARTRRSQANESSAIGRAGIGRIQPSARKLSRLPISS